jgi:peptide/nickel transport system permease protein
MTPVSAAMAIIPGRISSMRSFLRQPRAIVACFIILAAALAAIIGPSTVPYDPNAPDFAHLLAMPSSAHPFGTDVLGRDVLARVIAATRASVFVSAASVSLALGAGLTAGLVAGYFGRWADIILMLVADVVFSIPGILLALAIAAVAGPSTLNVIAAIAIVNTPVFARIARAQTLVVSQRGFVLAARAIGFGRVHIMFKTVLPDILPVLMVQASLLLASAMITESYLSFLGLGIQPPTPTLGGMLHESLGFLGLAQWLVWCPGVVIFMIVLGFNWLGDGLQDWLNPAPG